MVALLLLASLASADTLEGSAVLTVEGMTCEGCVKSVEAGLDGIDGVAGTAVEPGRACIDLSEPTDRQALEDTLTLRGFDLVAVAEVDDCPEDLAPAAKHRSGQLWSDVSGVDALVVSWGSEVDLSKSLRPDGFTVVHYGAEWCGACHLAEAALRDYLGDHDDTAVRAVILTGRTPSQSMTQPVVRQQLAGVAGLPWLVVYGPDQQVVYTGHSAPAATATIDALR